jgi:acyl carrier protein
MMATDEQLLDRITGVCVEALKVTRDRVTRESRFREDLGADSLDTIVLLMALEQEFKRPISDEEAAKLVSVNDAIALAKSVQATAAG